MTALPIGKDAGAPPSQIIEVGCVDSATAAPRAVAAQCFTYGCDIFNTNWNLLGAGFAVLISSPLSNGGYIRIATYVVNVGGHTLASAHLEYISRDYFAQDTPSLSDGRISLRGTWYCDEIQLRAIEHLGEWQRYVDLFPGCPDVGVLVPYLRSARRIGFSSTAAVYWAYHVVYRCTAQGGRLVARTPGTQIMSNEMQKSLCRDVCVEADIVNSDPTILLLLLRAIDPIAESAYRRILFYVAQREQALREICDQSGFALGASKKLAICAMYGETYFRLAETIGLRAHYEEPVLVPYFRKEVRGATRVIGPTIECLLHPNFCARGIREEHAMSLVLNVYEDAAAQLISGARMSLCPGKAWPAVHDFNSAIFFAMAFPRRHS